TDQRTDVQNDDDSTVAQDGCTRDTSDAGDLRTYRLHDDFPATDQLVGHQTGGMLAGTYQYHGYGDVLFRQWRRLEANERRQMLEPILLSAVVENRSVPSEVRQNLLLGEAQHALNGRQWQRVELVTRPHYQRMADRESERQSNSECSALTELRLHMERAPQALDLGRHNIHADAAAGLLRDRSRSGEPGLEDELHGILIAQHLS